MNHSQSVQTVDQVIEQLTQIIDSAVEDQSRLGYFAALYRKVTVKVKQRIAEGFFEDAARMERLDVIFAARYFDAVEAWRGGQAPARAWRYAFDQAQQFWPIVLQHLLLGMNAHINLDLGIAAAQTAAGSELPALRADFNRINAILGSLLAEVQEELAEVWPLLRVFNRFLGRADDEIINFSMEAARDHAWSVAERLAPLPPVEQENQITQLDAKVAKFGRVIRNPGFTLGAVTKLVRLGEQKTIAETIRILT